MLLLAVCILSAQCKQGTPLHPNAEAKVVSTASFAPSTGSPRDVCGQGWHGDVLRMLMVVTPPPSSRQTRAPADSTATPPSLPPKTLHHSTRRTLVATKIECTATQGATSDGREGRGKSELQAKSVLPLSSPQTAHSPQGRFGHAESLKIHLATSPTCPSHSACLCTATRLEALRNPGRKWVKVAVLLPHPTAEQRTRNRRACHVL